MGVILGKNVMIYRNASGTTPIIAGAKSCSISSKIDLVEKASATQQSAKEFIAGREEWDVSLSYIVASGSGDASGGLLMKGQEYTLRVGIPGGSTLKGNAICVQSDLSGSVGSIATGQIKFKGNGPLSPA